MLKIGDILIAKDPCTMEDQENQNKDALIVGKQYTILEMNYLGEFLITSEIYEDHWFDKVDYLDFFIRVEEVKSNYDELINKFREKNKTYMAKIS
jgi:hypothetical protein